MAAESRSDSGARIGLYYPYIHFRDEEWLKLAVLYWDRIARIVPRGYEPQDSAMVRRLRSEFDFVIELEPSQGALESVARPFLNLIRLRGEELRRHYRLRVRDGDAATVDGRLVRTQILGLKIYHELDEALREAGLAVFRSDESGLGSIYLHPRLAGVYMAALAEEMAQNNKYSPVSDHTVEHLAASGLTVERIGQALLRLTPLPLGDHEVESDMAVLALRTVLPVGVGKVPIEKLIDFRHKHRVELSAYQAYVAGLTDPGGPLANLQAVDDPKALQAHLKVTFERQVEPELERLRRALRGIGLEAVDSAVSVRLPATIPVEANLAAMGIATPPEIHPLIAGSMLGLLLFRVARAKRAQARQAVQTSPAAYLMFAREQLTPRSLLQRLQTGLRHLAVGV